MFRMGEGEWRRRGVENTVDSTLENSVDSTLDIALDVSHSFRADEFHFGW